jgi:hypothetical protein
VKIKGILLNMDGNSYIRQYTKDGEFRDIKIVHSDPYIEINDNSVQLRQDKDGEYYLDHDDKTLGLETKE